MQKTLAILEVSQKQSYIFSSNRLRENVLRSNEIAYVTGEGEKEFGDFFAYVGGDGYEKEKNLIYAGGGHAIFQFDTKEQAKAFVRAVTLRAMQMFPGMEVFAALLDTSAYPDRTPAELLKMLSENLEKKKSIREASFHRASFGVEKLEERKEDSDEEENVTWRPIPKNIRWHPVQPETDRMKKRSLAEDKSQFKDFKDLVEDEEGGFLAVVHIDGNGMGKRVMKIYENTGNDWDACCRSLRAFSDGIKSDFEEAFSEMVKELEKKGFVDSRGNVRLRKIITAGDDICFVCDGRIGLLAAKIFLKKITKKENCEQPGLPYSACAGVALVHTKYPFHMAYDLSEELCSNAKRFGAQLDKSGTISAIDWHIQYGQLKDSLSAQREDYLCEDSTDGKPRHMELRPLIVHVPDDLQDKVQEETFGLRSWDFFNHVCNDLKENKDIARSKLKNLRNVIRQGSLETEYYLHETGTADNLKIMIASAADRAADKVRNDLSCSFGEENRSLIFDAIELSDLIDFGEGDKV